MSNLPSTKEIREWLWREENGGEHGVLINLRFGLWKMIWCPDQKSVCIIEGTLKAVKRIAKGLMRNEK